MKEWFYVVNDEQQGPVDEPGLKSLAAANTVTPDTLVWVEGMGSWTAFKDVPELNTPATTVSDTPAKNSTPALPSANAGTTSPQVNSSSTSSDEISVAACVSEGIDVFKTDWLNLMLIVLVLCGLSIVSHFIPFIGPIAFFVIHGALWVGSWVVLLQIIDKKEFKLGDIFSRFDHWWMSLLAGLIVNILIGIGSFFLILPGLVVAALLGFWAAICADEGKGSDFLDSIKKSLELAKPHWLNLFLLTLICSGIMIAGTLLLVVGIIPAMGIVLAILGVTYRKLKPKAA